MSPILNYTSEVKPERSAAQVADMLAKGGAIEVATLYDAGRAVGLGFTVGTPVGPRHFRLPVYPARVLAVLEREGVERRYRTPEQAERTAWRILKDWVEAQLAIVRTEMVTLDQVMLSYMQADGGRTVYDLYLDNQLRALPAADNL